MITLLQPRLPLRDPHDCTDGADELCLYEALFDTLIQREGKGYAPRLATSWRLSADARVWDFDLRPDVRFHDGSPCDAEAVCLSLRRMARPDKGYTLGAPGVWAQYLDGAKIESTGHLSLRITLPKSIADLLDVLVQGYIVAPASIADLETGKTLRPLGTGSYCLTAAAEGYLELARNETHFAGLPANPLIRVELEPDTATRIARLVEGSAAVAAALPVLEKDHLTAQGLTPVVTLSPVAIIYLLNAARPALADPRVRSEGAHV